MIKNYIKNDYLWCFKYLANINKENVFNKNLKKLLKSLKKLKNIKIFSISIKF